MKQRTFFLVYQAGIANVFEVKSAYLNLPALRQAKRILQTDFKTAESFCRGLAFGNHIVHSAACNLAGDVTDQQWSSDLDAQPFSDKFNPVIQTTIHF